MSSVFSIYLTYQKVKGQRFIYLLLMWCDKLCGRVWEWLSPIRSPLGWIRSSSIIWPKTKRMLHFKFFVNPALKISHTHLGLDTNLHDDGGDGDAYGHGSQKLSILNDHCLLFARAWPPCLPRWKDCTYLWLRCHVR